MNRKMSLQFSYLPNYFSIDDILATQERIPCKFLETVPFLGKLDSSSETKDLTAGAELELPLWLVQSISTGRQPVAEPGLPKIFKEAYREILKADPTAIDLHKFNLNFYEFGCYVKRIDARGDVKECLEQTFQRRFRQLMDLSEYKFIDRNAIDKLDTLERKLYQDSHQARMKLNTWLNESRVPMQAAEMVVNHKKRKRVNVDT